MRSLEALRRENAGLRLQLNQEQEALLENKRLTQLLALKQASVLRLVAARVIGVSSGEWTSGVIIDKGSRQGIRRGFIVLAEAGVVGRVVDTSATSSTVLLIRDPTMQFSALVQRSRQEGLITGTLGNTVLLKYLPKDADIGVGDTVVTSGLTELFPKGLPVGTVVGVEEELSGLSRYALIKPSANLSGLEEVMVVIPSVDKEP